MLSHQKSTSAPKGQAAPQAAPQKSSRAGGNAAQQDKLMAAGIGGAADTQESQANTLADAVMQRVRRAQQGPEQGSAKKPAARIGLSPDLVQAFEEEAGVDVSTFPLVTGGAAEDIAQQMSATALSANGTAFLPGNLSEDLSFESQWTTAHELAHLALGHANNGPARREASTTDLRLGYLTRGDTGKAVERLQNALVVLGHMSSADRNKGPGVFGPRTEASVRAFQASARITVDGEAGPQTEAALESAMARGGSQTSSETPAKSNTGELTGRPALSSGDTGKAVVTLQKRLNHYGASLGTDGEFGPNTRRAVVAFQKANQLAVTGEVGPDTAAALSGDSAKRFSLQTQTVDTSTDTTDTSQDTGEVNVGDADPKGILSSSKLNPTVKEKARTVLEGLQKKGLKPYLFEGHRTMERQNDLYAQGRSKGGSIVTYVKGGGSWHNYGLAVDIVFWDSKHKGPSWGGPHSQWTEVGKQATKAGFTRWLGTIGDYPHMEYHPKWGNDCSSLLSTYNNSGMSAVWKKAE